MSAIFSAHPAELELRRKFRVYDQDDSGSISMDELSSLLCDMGHDLSEEELQLSFMHYDADKSGRIEFDEFTRWWSDGGGIGGGGEREGAEGKEDTRTKM